jgi:hypothetical protein
MARVEQPDPSGQLGRHVHHLLPGFEQPLREWTAGTVAALDSPGRPASSCSRPGRC